MAKPYESYMGMLTIPRRVSQAAEEASLLLDYRTPRKRVVEAIEAAYPGIRREHIHVWTLRGKSRVKRLGALWDEWTALGIDLVDDGWKAPTGVEIFADSGTYAPTFLVGSWKDRDGAQHAFLCDGYAASAEAVQAASLSEVLEIDATMAVFSSTFDLPCEKESRLMQLDPAGPDFEREVREIVGIDDPDGARVRSYAEAIEDARVSNVPLGKRVLRADDFLPSKEWSVLASLGYMSRDPYTGIAGVEQVGEGRYRVSALLATRAASSRITFTFRLMEPFDQARHVFSPLLVRFLSGIDHTRRAVKISDSGRIRNELQTMFSQALEHNGDTMRVAFDRVDERVMSREKQQKIREVLRWYKQTHPVWFDWLQLT
jgi:hypothetical protein